MHKHRSMFLQFPGRFLAGYSLPSIAPGRRKPDNPGSVSKIPCERRRCLYHMVMSKPRIKETPA